LVWINDAYIIKVIKIAEKADILVIIGTSMQVYPAASLIDYVKPNTPIYFIEPKTPVSESGYYSLTITKEVASYGTGQLIDLLKP